MNRRIIKRAGALLLTLSAAVCCSVILRRKESADAPLSKRRGRRTEKNEEAARRAAALSAVADGIKEYATDFDGLYESLYQAAQNREMFSTEAYEEWCDRAGQSEDEAFKSAFESLFAKADIEDEALCREKYLLLLDCIAAAGIARDRDSKLFCVADERMHQAYMETEGQKPQIGAAYTVIKAAWLSGEKVIEYGVVMPGELNV